MMKSWNDIMFQRRYNSLLSTSIQTLLLASAAEFNRRFSKRLGIKAFVVDPGLSIRPSGASGRELTRRFWSLRARGGVSP
jgi:hypothetical protein